MSATGETLLASGGQKKQGYQLPCPIRKGLPDRYIHVTKNCKPDQRFNGVSKLREHLKRFHTSHRQCNLCGKIFSVGGDVLAALRDAHRCRKPDSPQGGGNLSKPTVMSEAQYDDLEKWAKRDTESSSKRTQRGRRTEGGAVVQHYAKIWKIFNPDQPVPELHLYARPTMSQDSAASLSHEPHGPEHSGREGKLHESFMSPVTQDHIPALALNGVVPVYGWQPSQFWPHPYHADFDPYQLQDRSQALYMTNFTAPSTDPGSIVFSDGTSNGIEMPPVPQTPIQQFHDGDLGGVFYCTMGAQGSTTSLQHQGGPDGEDIPLDQFVPEPVMAFQGSHASS